MTEPAKIKELHDVEMRLLKFTETLTRLITSVPADHATYISAALSAVSQAAGLVRQSRNSSAEPASADLLRQASQHVERSMGMLEPLQRTDLPLGELRSMTQEIKALAA